MGIHKLFNMLETKAPTSFREIPLEIYTSKKIAVDASKTIYQFAVATTNYQNKDNVHSTVVELTDKDGNPTG